MKYTYSDLYNAYKSCIRRKANTLHAIAFSMNAERNILSLRYQLENHVYFPGKSVCFVVQEPVIREIFAAPFRDRVVQHFVYHKVENIFEKYFIYTSCACRKNKGTHFGVTQLQKGIRSLSDTFTTPLWYLKMDIQAFFMSIDKKKLFHLFSEIVEKESEKNADFCTEKDEILWLIKTIIDHDPTKNYYKKGQMSLFESVPYGKSIFSSGEGKGLAIGNLTSQFFANVYLNPLDHFVKRVLKCKVYVRYVDDFVLLAQDKETCIEWSQKITEFCKNDLFLTTHPNKKVIQRVCNGIDFVGYRVFPKHILVRQKTVGKAKKKIQAVLEEGNEEKIVACSNSYLGMFRHAHSFRLRKKTIEKIEEKNKNIHRKTKDCFSVRVQKKEGNHHQKKPQRLVASVVVQEKTE